MWGSQEKNLGQKVNEKLFRVDPGEKNIIFQESLFWETETIFWRFGNFYINPWCVRVYGKLSKLQNLASVSQNRGSWKYFRCSCLAQSRLCILEWSNWAEILARSLKLEFMVTLFSTFYHFDQPIPCLNCFVLFWKRHICKYTCPSFVKTSS